MADNVIKKFLPRTLFGRSLLILVTPVLLIQVITTFMFFDRHWEKMTARLAFAVAGEIAVLANQYEFGRDPSRVARATEQALEMDVDFSDGAKLERDDTHYTAWESIVDEGLSAALEAQVKRPYSITIDIANKIITVDVQLSSGVMQVEFPQRRLFSSSAYIFLLWMIGSSIILLTIAVLFMRNQVRPIRRLAIAAERFGKGREVPFFKLEGAREVRQAAKAFMEMRDRIDRQIQQRTAMLAGVSHDLRTPLTRMKLQAEMLEGEDAQALKSDIVDMERMIEAYLQFARGEGGEQPERTDLKDLIGRVIDAVKVEGVKIDLQAEEGLSLQVRPVAFQRCISNLILNAAKYADKIDVSISRDEEAVQIVIDDNGPGISKDQHEDVFKPFFRGDSARNVKGGGVGLGLPIAQDIVFAHGGHIELDKSPAGGLRVVIDLPL